MAARAERILGDEDESAPSNWEKPFGTPDVHLAIFAGSSHYLQAGRGDHYNPTIPVAICLVFP